AGADRVVPGCPHVAEGCGGCGWQHVDHAAQLRLKRELVAEVLSRQGKVVDPAVVDGPPLATSGGRTTVRGLVSGGRFAYRRRRSHDAVPVDSCPISHPLVEELIAHGWFGDATEVTLRAGARTGERLVVVTPHAREVRVPEGVEVVGADELAKGRRAWFHEEVAGRSWRVSATSFFQARPDGADALVSVVGDAVERLAPDASRMVDLCSGVGLFAGTVGAGRRVVAVERHRPAVVDAQHNLADLDVRHVRASMGSWRPSAADVVVADPARTGLAKEGVGAVVATGADVCVLVSCDPASLGRDAGLLAAAGYHHTGTTVIDLFPHTPHIEAVSGFVRS
ncbi:MAG: SAM-dependent methyltransferase, tRNA(uracil-5)-methyltransferase, partial [Acidimicrobiales bacterium]|nr:SAM-dependent methyltransferase, tRNA(uracil-5)-methyltransferase [Acidimicrobiales bacterium]